MTEEVGTIEYDAISPMATCYYESENYDLTYHLNMNISYTATMKHVIPDKYIETKNYPEKKISSSEIVDHYLYYAKLNYRNLHDVFKTYIGISKEYTYYWGIGLKEIMKNNVKVLIKGHLEYEGKASFKAITERVQKDIDSTDDTDKVKKMMKFLHGLPGSKMEDYCTKRIKRTKDIEKTLIKRRYKILPDTSDKKHNIYEVNVEGPKAKGANYVSYISAIMKFKMVEAMRRIGYDNIIYCNNDYILAKKLPPTDMMDQKEEGKWRQVFETIKELRYNHVYNRYDAITVNNKQFIIMDENTIDDGCEYKSKIMVC